MKDEAELVQLAQQRNAEAFGRLYDEHFDRIYRYLMAKTGVREEAEDLTQQVFLNAWDAIGSYKSKGVPFSSWLFRIAHNLMVDYHRKRSIKKELPLEEAESLPSAEGSDPASLTEMRLGIEELAAACEDLTEAQRGVLYLRFVAGLSVAEVAKAVGKKEGAVKVMQHS